MLKQTIINSVLNSHSAPKKRQTGSVKLVIALLTAICSFSTASKLAFAAAATWSPEQVISRLTTSTQIANIRSAVNNTGTSVIIWDQSIPGSGDATHLYGRWQVYASVCTPPSAQITPICSAPYAFTDGTSVPDATNAGAVVSPSGTVTVFWNSFATPTIYSASSNSADSGQNWSTSEQLPGGAGYTLLSGVYAEVGPSVGVDGNGNIIVAMVNPPSTTPLSKTGYSVQTLVKDSTTGLWSSPLQLSNAAGIYGSAKLFVNSDGQALLNFGYTSFRRDSQGHWGAPQTVSTAGKGQIYSASAGFDAGGKAYFVYRTRYFGAFLSTSTPTSAWTTPKHIAKFDILGSSLIVRGSSAGHAIVYGNDMNTGNVRATVTADGATTWGNLVSFGLGSNPRAAGSENGLYAISWDSTGVNWDRYFVASGTGIGTGTAAWVKKNLAGNNATGPVSIAGSIPGGNSQTVAAWLRWDTVDNLLGISACTVTS